MLPRERDSVCAEPEWPLPAFYELAPGEVVREREPAVVTLAQGDQLHGTLSRFLPTYGEIELLPLSGKANLHVALKNVQELRLTRALRLQPRKSALAGSTEDLAPLPLHQPFRVEFRDGKVIDGDTAGFQLRSYGLFLYLVSPGVSVVRSFIPSTAIRTHNIGRPLGEMLVRERLLSAEHVDVGLRHQKLLRERKLGELLVAGSVVSQEGLHAALEHQRATPIKRLGEALLDAHAITREQLAQALAQQKTDRGKPLGEILIGMGYLERGQLLRVLSQKLGVPRVDLTKFNIDAEALQQVPGSVARQRRVMPLCYDGPALVVAMENPLDSGQLEELRFVTRSPIVPVMASAQDLDTAIRVYFAPLGDGNRIEELATQLSSETLSDGAVEEEYVRESDSTLVRLVNKIIVDAHVGGISDIHVEANSGRDPVKVRFRKDGVLFEYLQLPPTFRRSIVSRIKIMANLDISERRRGQDGRVNFAQFGPANIELRVATIPTHNGLEDVVLRVLGGGEPLPLAKLGFAEPLLERTRELLKRPHGLFLVCGPTGSGKTTTLHSLLAVLNSPERKIWTAEDPVEITQSGIRQVQVNPRAGWTFATALRSFLRADPDIVMIGEMRDAETATIAIEASLTGHLVLSTLHTNSAPETVVRLLEMGLDPFNFADSLAAVLAQRLVRRLCPSCSSSRELSPDEVGELAKEYCQEMPFVPDDVIAGWRKRFGETLRLYGASGCEQCRRTGYQGRIGLHELLVVDAAARQLIQRRMPASELWNAAVSAGMRTLKQDGIEKCLDGLTDLHEVRATAA